MNTMTPPVLKKERVLLRGHFASRPKEASVARHPLFGHLIKSTMRHQSYQF